MVVSGAVPVLLTVRRPVDVPGTQLDDVLVTCSDEAAALGHVERLAALVGVPSSSSARREVDRADVELRSVVRLDDAVDPDVSGEPLGRPLDRRLLRLESQCVSFVQLSSVRTRAGVVARPAVPWRPWHDSNVRPAA